MREPQRMLEQAGSPNKSVVSHTLPRTRLTGIRYLEQLRLLAANWASLDISTRTAMKSASFLLASQRVPVRRPSKKLLGDFSASSQADEYEREWVLCRASEVSSRAVLMANLTLQVAVVDDITYLQYFGRYILVAPEVSPPNCNYTCYGV